MSKIQLILSDSDYTSFDQPWIRPIINNYFDLQYIEHDIKINSDAVFITNVNAHNNNWYYPYVENGHKLITDNLWEIPEKHDIGFVITNQNWFWYNESLWYRQLGYHAHVSNPNICKNSLLLMNLRKPHRDWIYSAIDKENSLYSYVGLDKTIAGDIDINDSSWQRYFNSEWYNSTAFSLVSETTIDDDLSLFVTEKTFKPIAFLHPFVICGQYNILVYLHRLGFETFENMFDESYDNEYDSKSRIAKAVTQANLYTHSGYDYLTLSKLKHNQELFFNEQLVKNKIIKEIIEPMIEYAET